MRSRLAVFNLVVALGLAVLISTACSNRDSVFSRPPALTMYSHASVAAVADCIAARWKASARHLHRVRRDNIVMLQAQSFFSGVKIGVRLRPGPGATLVQFFERRVADPLYAAMVRACALPAGTIAPANVKGSG
ncbi:MAG TPA: hypothetical protein VL689_06555 [Paraburkholderia sp.]|jgi:hypothetical protein|nr:hypothetical protein [Paraburkholderia sp.]